MTHTPDLRDRVPQGAGAYVVNTKIESGLPNITGYWGDWVGYQYTGGESNNAFWHDGWAQRGSQDSGYYGYAYMYFNASRCSSVYKDDCTTVQPPAVAVNFYIKAK